MHTFGDQHKLKNSGSLLDVKGVNFELNLNKIILRFNKGARGDLSQNHNGLFPISRIMKTTISFSRFL